MGASAGGSTHAGRCAVFTKNVSQHLAPFASSAARFGQSNGCIHQVGLTGRCISQLIKGLLHIGVSPLFAPGSDIVNKLLFDSVVNFENVVCTIER